MFLELKSSSQTILYSYKHISMYIIAKSLKNLSHFLLKSKLNPAATRKGLVIPLNLFIFKAITMKAFRLPLCCITYYIPNRIHFMYFFFL